MITTVNEAHVLFDILTQESNSEVKRTIAPQSKDYYLNIELLSWIKTRSNPKTNIKKEGLYESVKRIDDLKNLESPFKLTLYNNDSISLFGILPHDYMSYITSYCYTSYNCSTSSYTNTTSDIKYIVLPLDTNKPIKKDFTISMNGTTLLSTAIFNASNAIEHTRPDSIFIAVNYVLQYINRISTSDYKLYWERYGDLYHPNSFILVSTGTLSSASMSYNNGTTTYTITVSSSTTLSYSKINILSEGSPTKECILVSSDTGVRGILNNRVKSRNLQEHPIVTLEGNKLIIYHNNKIQINNVNIKYLRKPTLYNIVTGSMPEIEHHEEVVSRAVKHYLGSLGDQVYQIEKDIEQELE